MTRTILLCALASLLGCGPAAESAAPRLVILYATCTLNKGFLSPYDPAVAWTPHLAAFADRSLVFERHQTESGISGVAFASILSGGQATRHGVFSHPSRLADDVELIGEAFARAGWEVSFWADHPMASPSLGYGQGVAPERTYVSKRPLGAPDPRRPPPREGFLRAEDARFRRILERLESDPEGRALLITTFTVTHAPYSSAWLDVFCARHPRECEDPSPEAFEASAELLWRHYVDLSWDFDETVSRLALTAADRAALERSAERLYAANVHRLDGLFGDLLAEVASHGLEDESLVAFTADHGEVLQRENAALRWNHGFSLAPEVLSVPWIVGGPGIAPGRQPGVTRSIDVLPTLAGLAGIDRGLEDVDPGDDGIGRNLAPVLLGRRELPRLEAFSHTALVPQALLDVSRARGGTRLDALHPDRDPEGMWVSLRDGDMVFKLIRPSGGAFEPKAFDLASDPRETVDVFDPTDPGHVAAAARLRAYKRSLVEAARSSRSRPIVQERRMRLLRSLGYVE